jgi:hypothetical protein
VDNTQNILRLKDSQGKKQSLVTDRRTENMSASDVDHKQFSKGDEIVLLKNDRKLGV